MLLTICPLPHSHANDTPSTLNSLELIDDTQLGQWGELLFPSTSHYHQYHYASEEEGVEKTTASHHKRRGKGKKGQHHHAVRKSKFRSRHLGRAVVGSSPLDTGKVGVSADPSF